MYTPMMSNDINEPCIVWQACAGTTPQDTLDKASEELSKVMSQRNGVLYNRAVAVMCPDGKIVPPSWGGY